MSGKFFNSFFKGEGIDEDTPHVDNIDMQSQIDQLVALVEEMTGRIGRLEARIAELESLVVQQNQRPEKDFRAALKTRFFRFFFQDCGKL